MSQTYTHILRVRTDNVCNFWGLELREKNWIVPWFCLTQLNKKSGEEEEEEEMREVLQAGKTTIKKSLVFYLE